MIFSLCNCMTKPSGATVTVIGNFATTLNQTQLYTIQKKNLTSINALAYFVAAQVTKNSLIITLTSGRQSPRPQAAPSFRAEPAVAQSFQPEPAAAQSFQPRPAAALESFRPEEEPQAAPVRIRPRPQEAQPQFQPTFQLQEPVQVTMPFFSPVIDVLGKIS
jgi:hypothetical protein